MIGSINPTSARPRTLSHGAVSGNDQKVHLLGSDGQENFSAQDSHVGCFKATISGIKKIWNNVNIFGKALLVTGIVGTVVGSVFYYTSLPLIIATTGVSFFCAASLLLAAFGTNGETPREIASTFCASAAAPWLAPLYFAPIFSLLALGLCPTERV